MKFYSLVHALRVIILALFFANSLKANLPENLQDLFNQKFSVLRKNIPADYTPQQIRTLLKRLSVLLTQKHQKPSTEFSADDVYKYLKKKITDQGNFKGLLRLEQIDKNNFFKNIPVKKLIDSYDGNLTGEILTIKYRNILIPLSLSIVSESEADLAIIGIDVDTGRWEKCLSVFFDQRRMSISWLGPGDVACPLLGEKQGNFLLDFVQDISKMLELKTIVLSDASSVTCMLNQKIVDLRLLKIFQTGESWYENHGYSPYLSPKHISDYLREKEIFTNYNIQELKRDADAMSSYQELQILRAKLNEYLAKPPSLRFADFMAWLYANNCDEYTQIFKLLFNHTLSKMLKVKSKLPSNPDLVKFL